MRAQGRKIIFTTNLPNVSDLNDALLRPGRCFANVRTRGLYRAEAEKLVARLVPLENRRDAILDAIFANASVASLASVYCACQR